MPRHIRSVIVPKLFCSFSVFAAGHFANTAEKNSPKTPYLSSSVYFKLILQNLEAICFIIYTYDEMNKPASPHSLEDFSQLHNELDDLDEEEEVGVTESQEREIEQEMEELEDILNTDDVDKEDLTKQLIKSLYL